MTRPEMIVADMHALLTEPGVHLCVRCGNAAHFGSGNDTWKVAKNATCDACTPPTSAICHGCNRDILLEWLNPFFGCPDCTRKHFEEQNND